MSDVTDTKILSRVPSLVDLAIETIALSPDALAFSKEIPEELIHKLVRSLCKASPDLLPSALPASLSKLDLSGHISLDDQTLFTIINRCSSLTSLCLNNNCKITNVIFPMILWHLPNLDQLRMTNLTHVTSLSEIKLYEAGFKNRPCTLRVLEIENCRVDASWFENLVWLPFLEHFKISNVYAPKEVLPDTQISAHLRSVDISFLPNDPNTDAQRDLFSFFLYSPRAAALERLIYNPNVSLTVEHQDSDINAINLRVLETNGRVLLSQHLLAALGRTCIYMTSFKGVNAFGFDTILGQWQLEQNNLSVRLEYGHFNYVFMNPTLENFWTTRPKSINIVSNNRNQTLIGPIDPVLTLERLDLTNVTIQDISLFFSQFPNLTHLALKNVNFLNLENTKTFDFVFPNLECLHLESKVDLATIKAISSKADSLKKVVLAPALVKEFKQHITVWIATVLAAFPSVENLTLTTLSWNALKQFKVELGVMNTRESNNLKFLKFRRTKVRNAITTDDPYLECEFNFVSKTNFELLPHLLYLEMNHVRINEDIILGGPRMKMLWIEGQLTLGPAAQLGFPSRILTLAWRVNAFATEISHLLPGIKYLQSIYVLRETMQQFRTAVPLIPTSIKHRCKHAQLLHERSARFYGRDPARPPAQAKPLIDPLYRKHSYTEEEIQDIAEMFAITEISMKHDEPAISLKLKIAKGPLLIIRCNPSHRVMDLYGYARHAIQTEKGFDLVKFPNMILDVRTYRKTIREMELERANLVQVLREYDEIENELKFYSLFYKMKVNHRNINGWHNNINNVNKGHKNINSPVNASIIQLRNSAKKRPLSNSFENFPPKKFKIDHPPASSAAVANNNNNCTSHEPVHEDDEKSSSDDESEGTIDLTQDADLDVEFDEEAFTEPKLAVVELVHENNRVEVAELQRLLRKNLIQSDEQYAQELQDAYYRSEMK